MMQSHFHITAISVLVLLCSSCSAPRATDLVNEERPDVTVSFHVQGEHGGLDQTTLVWLNASKPSRSSITSGEPESPAADGTHKFPSGTTASAIAAYYGPILTRAGWNRADFQIIGNAIHFYQPTRITARSSVGQLVVSVSPH